MTEDETARRVLAAMAEAAPGLKLDGLDPERPFRDQLDIDSVDYLNFVMAIERSFGIAVGELDFPKLSTLSGAVVFIRSAQASAGRPGVV